jgi:hypothetical protein
MSLKILGMVNGLDLLITEVDVTGERVMRQYRIGPLDLAYAAQLAAAINDVTLKDYEASRPGHERMTTDGTD